MLKKVTALFLILLMLVSNVTRLFIYAGYQLNQTYIATTLCINKDKPQMHCNGRCYLAKKLKQAEDKEKEQERRAQKHLVQEAFITSHQHFVFTAVLLQEIGLPGVLGVTRQCVADIFRPPQV